MRIIVNRYCGRQVSDRSMNGYHVVQLVEPNPGVRLGPARSRAAVPGRPASLGKPGSGRSGTLPARPIRAAHADLPRCLHAARRDPLRSLCPFGREGDRLAFDALGRGHRSMRRSRRQRFRPHHPEPGAVRLSDLRTEPPAALRHTDRTATSCPALADGGAPPAGDASRALGWLGPGEIEAGLEAIMPKLFAEDFGELAAARAILPIWMAEPLSALIAHG